MRIFSYDSRFSQTLLKLSYSCWLNVLWMACSLPIFTIGASTTALYTVTLRIARDEESHITRDFFSAFKKNFRQATRLWLIMLVIGIVIGFDIFIVNRLRSTVSGAPAVMWTLLQAVIIGAAVVYTIILIMLFPLLAYFDNTDRAMIKNAFLIGVRYLFSTILIFAIHFAVFFLIVSVFTPLAIFGEGLSAMLSSLLLVNVFRTIAYVPEEDR